MATIEQSLSIAIEHQRHGRMPQAETIYRQVLQLDPNNVDALHLLGVLASQVGDQATAVKLISRAIRLRGDFGVFHLNLGVAYRRMGQPREALAACRRAIELAPALADAHTTIGTVYQGQGQHETALEAYARAIEINPHDVDAHQNRALCWLALGDFERGWAEYEWRWRQTDFHQPPMPRPRWDGSPLAGRRLLVQCEQGLGDTIQLVRLVRQLESQGEKTLLIPQEPLVGLLASSGIKNLVPPGSALPDFDVYIPLMSLPHMLRTTLATIPAQVPYLAADPQLVAAWRARLRAMGRFTVGIAWQGNPSAPHEPARSIPLAEFRPLVRGDVSLISLQKGPGVEQIDAAARHFDLVNLDRELDESHGPFMDTAAIMSSLDLVITSDTVTAHLAGALGVPVWVALPSVADWRWMPDRADSPWYPTMRLFRQASPGDWSSVFDTIAGELQKLVARHGGSP